MIMSTNEILELKSQLHSALAACAEMRSILSRTVEYAQDLDWSDDNSVFNYASHRKSEAALLLASSTAGQGYVSPERFAEVEAQVEELHKLYQERGVALTELEREKAGLQKELVAANRGAERNANVNRLVTQKNIQLMEALRLWQEYAAFLNIANEAPIRIAHAHGWRCPDEEVQAGQHYRDRIAALTQPAAKGDEKAEPKFKVGDMVRFKLDHPDIPKKPFPVIDVRPDVDGNMTVSISSGCWYGEGAFELAENPAVCALLSRPYANYGTSNHQTSRPVDGEGVRFPTIPIDN